MEKTFKLLDLANKICEELGVEDEEKLQHENILFSDEFYAEIINYLALENSISLGIGKTKKDKVEGLIKLKEFLSDILEMSLNHINPYSIIYEEDRNSVKYLLELIFELIIVLKGQVQVSNKEKIKSENLIENQNRHESFNLDFDEEPPISRSYPNIEINNLNNSNMTDKNLYNDFEISYTSYTQQLKKRNRNTKISEQTTNINEKSSTPNKSKISRNDYFNNTINLAKIYSNKNPIKKASVSDNNMSFSNEIHENGVDEKSDISEISKSINKNERQNLSFELNIDTNFEIMKTCGELPLSESNIKSEIKKRLLEICLIHPFKKFKDEKSINQLIQTVLDSLKDFKIKCENENFKQSQKSLQFQYQFQNANDNKEICITKEFLINHEKELQKIIIYFLIKRDERISYVNNIAKNIVNDSHVVNRINNYILRKNEIKVKKIKERYRNLREQYKDELIFCNRVMSRNLELEKQKIIEEKNLQNEINEKIENEHLYRAKEIDKNLSNKIQIYQEYASKDKYFKEKEKFK